MKLTITIRQSHRKPLMFVTSLDKRVNLDVLKKLWEAEQTLNNLPGADLRVHVSVDEDEVVP